MSAVLSPADRSLAAGFAGAVTMERNSHVHPVMAGVLSAMAPAPAPMHSERIDWWPVGSPRQIPDGRLLLKLRRGDRREGYMDAGGVWRLADFTVADAIAYAEMPEGPL